MDQTEQLIIKELALGHSSGRLAAQGFDLTALPKIHSANTLF